MRKSAICARSVWPRPGAGCPAPRAIGLWLGPWLYDVVGQPRHTIGNYLFVTALAYTLGSIFFGVSSDRLAAAGLSRLTMFKLGLAVSVAIFWLLALGVTDWLGALPFVYGFTTIPPRSPMRCCRRRSRPR